MILNLILVAGLLVTFGLTVLSFLSKIPIAKKYLSPVFLLLSFEIFYFYSELHDNRVFQSLGFFLSEGFGSLIGPLLWLYVRAAVNKPIKPTNRFYYFIYPTFNLLVIVMPISVCLFMESWILDVYLFLAKSYDLIILPENILNIFYFAFSLNALLKHQKRIKDHFSQTISSSLDWLKKMCLGGVVIITIDISTTLYEHMFGAVSWNIGFISIVGLCFFLFYLSYYGFKQQKVIMPYFVYEIEENKQNNSASSKERIYLKKFEDSEIVQYKKQLLNIMEEQHFFLKSDIILTDLAQELDLTDKQTTELLNLELKTNFYDFVNNYRVKEVKTKITSSAFEHLTLLAIGLDSGFHCKSSFNRVFKKSTGVSPSEYKKSLIK